MIGQSNIALTRRRLLVAGAGLALAGSQAQTPAWAARIRPKIGLQLYTVMDLLNKDLEGTLKAVAALGYREVETLGAFGFEPGRLRAALDGAGLTSPSQHLMPAGLENDFAARVHREISMAKLEERFLARFADIDAMIDEAARWAKALGQTYLVWQIVWPSQLSSKQALDNFIAGLNRAGELAKRQGLRLAFHNHGNELVAVQGERPYDRILAGTNPSLVDFEMDVCWMVSKGADPVAYMRDHPGRYQLMHLKDVNSDGKSVPVGQGVVPFQKVIRQARRSGVKHLYMELDAPKDPMQVIADAARYLEPML